MFFFFANEFVLKGGSVTSYVHKCSCGSACFFLSLLLALSLSLSIS